MIEPVELQNFMLAFFSSALVIVSGALYALLFALAKVHGRPGLLGYAYGAYALLVGSVAVLASVMNLSGAWSVIVGVMILGYLLAPHGIWHLCEGTHRADNGRHDPSNG